MKKFAKKPPCRVCMTIRLFLLGVFGLAVIGLIDRDLVAGLSRLSPLTIAVLFVSTFAAIAGLKTFAEYRQLKSKQHD